MDLRYVKKLLSLKLHGRKRISNFPFFFIKKKKKSNILKTYYAKLFLSFPSSLQKGGNENGYFLFLEGKMKKKKKKWFVR